MGRALPAAMWYGREASAAAGAHKESRRRESGGGVGPWERSERRGRKVEHGGGAEAARVVFFFPKYPACVVVLFSLHAVSSFLPAHLPLH